MVRLFGTDAPLEDIVAAAARFDVRPD